MKNKLSILLAMLFALILTGCVSGGQNTSYNNAQSYESAKDTSIAVAKGLPDNYAEFKERCQTMLKTPAGAIKMYFDGVFVYADPQTRREGQKMLRYVMRADANWDGAASSATFVSRLKDPSKHYIFRSFAKGTSPENGYNMSPDNYSIEIVNTSKESDYTRVNIVSTGADSPRTMWVKQFDDGLWYVINNSGSYVDVRQPTKANNNSHDADYD